MVSVPPIDNRTGQFRENWSGNCKEEFKFSSSLGNCSCLCLLCVMKSTLWNALSEHDLSAGQ